jgi:wyosine [tRNA(Phe)-imidazoG37] synthetase (radical SAM superfamily)
VPQLAALTQLIAIIYAGLSLGKRDLFWGSIYWYAAVLLDQRPSLSLSRIGRTLIQRFVWENKRENYESATDARSQSSDRRQQGWRVFLPDLIDLPTDAESIFRAVEFVERPTHEQLRRQLREFVRQMKSPGHYTLSKYLTLFSVNWKAVEAIVKRQPMPEVIPVYFEVHPDHRCQNKCGYCRGGLRDVPEYQSFIGEEHLVHIVNSIYEINKKAFIRYSGAIGDPLLNPAMKKVLEHCNALGMDYGITTNGIDLNKEGISEALMKSTYVHVSLDAGSPETYRDLKGGKEEYFERVMSNIQRLVEMRKAEGSKTRIIVSWLLQSENYQELEGVAQRLNTMGIDDLQIKMQHWDEHRHMTRDEVKSFYEKSVKKVRKQAPNVTVTLVQDEEMAMAKIGVSRKKRSDLVQIGETAKTEFMPFDQCFAQRLRANTTIGPAAATNPKSLSVEGLVHACCQYFEKQVLEPFGETDGMNLRAVLESLTRENILSTQSPRDRCKQCSPSDYFINFFMQFLIDTYDFYPAILDDARKLILGVAHAEEQRVKGESLGLPTYPDRSASENNHIAAIDTPDNNPDDEEAGSFNLPFIRRPMRAFWEARRPEASSRELARRMANTVSTIEEVLSLIVGGAVLPLLGGVPLWLPRLIVAAAFGAGHTDRSYRARLWPAAWAFLSLTAIEASRHVGILHGAPIFAAAIMAFGHMQANYLLTRFPPKAVLHLKTAA